MIILVEVVEMSMDPPCKGRHADFRHMRLLWDYIQDWNETYGIKLQGGMTETKWSNPIPMRPMDN